MTTRKYKLIFRNSTAEKFINMLNDAYPDTVPLDELYINCIEDRIMVTGRIHKIAHSAMRILEQFYDGAIFIESNMAGTEYGLSEPLPDF